MTDPTDRAALVRDTYTRILGSLRGRWPAVNELPRNPGHPAAEYGFVLPDLGATACVVRVGSTPDGTVRLNLWAPAVVDVAATDQLVHLVGRESVRWDFGCLGLFPTPNPERFDLAFDYSIPTAALSPAVLDRLIRIIATAADDLGSRLRGKEPDTRLSGTPLPLRQPTRDEAYRQVGGWLAATWPQTTAAPQVWGYRVPGAGDVTCAVVLDEANDQTVRVVLSAIVADDVTPGPDLYERIGDVATEFLFGTIGVYPGGSPGTHAVAFHHAVPVAALTPESLRYLVRVTASSAVEVAEAGVLD